MPELNLTTTLAAELGHNTSANPAYNKSGFAANFTGTTWINNSGATLPVDSSKFDDSLNPITPCHVSPVSVHSMCPGFLGPYYAHVTPWFRLGGGGGHIDVGLNNNSTNWVNAMTADLQGRGFDGINIDWYGSGRYEDTVTLLIKTRVAAMSNFTYAIMMDQGGYANTAALQANMAYLNATYFGQAGYQTIAGKPVVLFFGTVGGVDYAATKALYPNTYWIMQGPGQLGNSWADAVFDWVQPYSTGVPGGDPYNAAATNSFLTSTHSTAKGVMPAISPGFNGYLTALVGWSKGKYMPRDNGKCWLSQAALVSANLPTNIIGIHVPTFNDWEEGSEIESAIDNGLVVSSSIVNNILSFSVADESTVSSYRILASPDGITAVILATPSTGGIHILDLTTFTGWGAGLWTIYVVALGKSCIRCQSSAGLTYTAPVSSVPQTSTVATSITPRMATVSRKKMPSIEAAANGDPHALRLWLKHLDSRLSTQEQSTGGGAFNSDTQSPVTVPPPRAQVQVRQTGGMLAVTVKNPQFLPSSIPGRKAGNLLRAPITHVVEYSADGFKTVTSLPPSTQNHYSVPSNGKTLQFRVKSSLDGVTFNKPQVISGVSS